MNLGRPPQHRCARSAQAIKPREVVTLRARAVVPVLGRVRGARTTDAPLGDGAPVSRTALSSVLLPDRALCTDNPLALHSTRQCR